MTAYWWSIGGESLASLVCGEKFPVLLVSGKEMGSIIAQERRDFLLASRKK